jgi:glycopeptide antibiotics resistance protein
MDLITPGHGLIFWQVAGIAYIAFWIYAIMTLVNSEFKASHMKLIWALIIIFMPFGAFLYLANSRRGKKRDFNPDFSKISKTEKI